MSTPVTNSRATKLTRWQVFWRVPISPLLVNRAMPFADSRGSIRATTTARCGPRLKIPRKTSSHIVIILSHAKEILPLSIPNGQHRHRVSVSWKTQFLGFYHWTVHFEINVFLPTNALFINLVKRFKFILKYTIISLLHVSVFYDHHQGALCVPN